ncbi:MAG: aminotransferase class I/II-fold pyridoxal phosphate-dependent enzyme [Candidatus Fimivivens sp.]
MPQLDQTRAPIYEALEKFKKMRVVPFDVPGHKRGRGNPELKDFLGEKCVGVDINSMKPLDNLCHPISVIKDAQALAADAFGAANAFFMVNGTTSSVQAMVLTCCKRGDKIILPRNVHRSVINALVLCGAHPVYVNPEVDKRLGISLGMSVAQVEQAIKAHPDAVAIFINNPTYYGICSDIRHITQLAHAHGMKVLADEAHGTHFYFGRRLPVSAISAGADMAAVSMHKSGGSLTQSALLLTGANMNPGYVSQIINLTQTTSGSYLLLSSLDISRKNLALRGKEIFRHVQDLTQYAREEINRIGGYYAYAQDLINNDSIFDFDSTKLSVYTLDIGLAGIEIYDLLRDEYDIQVEFGDLGNILAYVSVGDRIQDIERLVSALAEIRRRYQRDRTGLMAQEYLPPQVVVTPQDAFYAEKTALPLDKAVGHICSEFVMCYPPGIPILAPGERITRDILDYIAYAKEKGCSMTGPQDVEINHLNVLRQAYN